MNCNIDILRELIKFQKGEIVVFEGSKESIFEKIQEINDSLKMSNRPEKNEIVRILESLQRSIIDRSISNQELKDRIKRLMSKTFLEFFELESKNI